MARNATHSRVGSLLREWRTRRRRTQLELALDAGVSARHLSFIETGRSKPSLEMVLLLAKHLEVPVRERNQLLLAAGYAPAFPERQLEDPMLAPVREALDRILTGHEPYPAVVVDRRWNMVAANRAMAAIGSWVDPQLLQPPINVMRAGLHPRGLARWTLNLEEVRAHFLGRLRRQVAMTGDGELASLLEEVVGYQTPGHVRDLTPDLSSSGHILMPSMRMRGPGGEQLSLFATVATFWRGGGGDDLRAFDRADVSRG
jgi:transcriptional regulator with XRE-family HTH domain